MSHFKHTFAFISSIHLIVNMMACIYAILYERIPKKITTHQITNQLTADHTHYIPFVAIDVDAFAFIFTT